MDVVIILLICNLNTFCRKFEENASEEELNTNNNEEETQIVKSKKKKKNKDKAGITWISKIKNYPKILVEMFGDLM